MLGRLAPVLLDTMVSSGASFKAAWFDPHTGVDDHGRGPSTRSERAKTSHVPMTKEKLASAIGHERDVVAAIGGEHIGGNKPVDVVIRSGGRITHAIEVKAIFGKRDKITMHGPSLARKEKFATKNKAEAHTVAIDTRGRTPVYYHRAGFGSYRLHSMTKATSISHLHKLVRG